jgi:hypothetical protein
LNSGRDQSIKSNIELGIKIRKEILQKFKEKFSKNYPDSIFDIFSRNIALTISGNDINDEDEAIDMRVEEMNKALIGSTPTNIEEIKRNYQKFLKESEKYFEEKNRLSQGNRAPEDLNKILIGIEIRRKIIDQFNQKYSEFAMDDVISVSSGSYLSWSLSPDILESSSSLVLSPQILSTSLKYPPKIPCKRSLNQARDSNYRVKYDNKEYLIKEELAKMRASENLKDNIFFKNYLLKHLELIKLYKTAKKEIEDEFKKAKKSMESVDQEFNQLENEARKDCLNFLLANVSDLKRLTSEHGDNPLNRLEDKGGQNQDNNFELAEEISKLRSLIPPIFNPLKPQGQTPDEKAIFSFLLKQQRILLSQRSGSKYGKEPQPILYRPPNPTPYRPTSPTPYRPPNPTPPS